MTICSDYGCDMNCCANAEDACFVPTFNEGGPLEEIKYPEPEEVEKACNATQMMVLFLIGFFILLSITSGAVYYRAKKK